jgi:hypothetical protein
MSRIWNVVRHFPLVTATSLCCTSQTKVVEGLMLGEMIRM